MYAKLFSTLCMSSIWSESLETRVLWITLLASATPDGVVLGSPVGLAAVARLPVPAVIESLGKLLDPDPYSSDLLINPENEGRRLAIVPGGWLILNYTRYRGIRDEEMRKQQNAEASQRYRDRKKA